MIIAVAMVSRTSWVMRERVFFVRRRLVWLIIVCVMVRLWIQRIVLGVVVGWVERVMLLIFFVVAVGIVYILHRVL